MRFPCLVCESFVPDRQWKSHRNNNITNDIYIRVVPKFKIGDRLGARGSMDGTYGESFPAFFFAIESHLGYAIVMLLLSLAILGGGPTESPRISASN